MHSFSNLNIYYCLFKESPDIIEYQDIMSTFSKRDSFQLRRLKITDLNTQRRQNCEKEIPEVNISITTLS